VRRNLFLLFAGLLNCVLACHASAQLSTEPAPPSVVLASGILQGTHFGAAQNEVASLGVPFASSPVGDLRWKPPQPVLPWSGTRQATQLGAPCPQLPAKWFPYIDWSEDCIFLNVWTTHLDALATRWQQLC
jgi:carboxylesterase type B